MEPVQGFVIPWSLHSAIDSTGAAAERPPRQLRSSEISSGCGGLRLVGLAVSRVGWRAEVLG